MNSNAGAERMADVLKQNSTLHVLDLGKNNITEKGIESMASAIKKNKSLHHNHTLVLNENIISVGGAMDLADALAANGTLQVINWAERLVLKVDEQKKMMPTIGSR